MNEVRVKISGLNLPRLINRLVDKNILLNNLVVKKNHIVFTISEDKLTELDKICKLEHKYYVILQKNGFKRVLYKLPYLFGALLALIISFTYLYSFDKYIFNVSVSYESELPYDLNHVNELLVQNGIVSGMKKKDISKNNIQNMLLLNIDNISGCSVNVKGGNLNICVYPATMKEENNDKDIISKYNAVITKAEAYSGNLAVKVGDLVQVGDVLIKNQNGASGKIEGKVYFVSTIIYNENQQYTEKTGNTYKVKNLNFCNLFWVKGKNRCTFASYIVEKCDYFVAPYCILPVKVQEDVYYEVEIKNKIVPFEEVETSVLSSAYNDALKKVPNKDNITNVTYSVVSEGSYTRVDCFVETIIDII